MTGLIPASMASVVKPCSFFIRFLVVALVAALPSCTDSPTDDDPFHPPASNDGWPVSTPEAQGLDRGLMLSGYAAAGQLPYLHSLLVVRRGYLVAEEYFNGRERAIPDNVMSVSKSILSGLVGIARDKGYIDSLEARVLDYFPEYASPSLDVRKHDITLRHLLMMRAGFDSEQQNYFQVHTSPNWIKATIELPLMFTPGEKMRYNTFETHLLSAILTKATETSSFEFARRYICDPLGMTLQFWERDPQGYYFGGNGMGFTPRDMAKYGLLYLRRGNHDGRQVIPAQWIEESLTNYTNWQDLTWGDVRNYNYGYLWWMGEISGARVYFALGHGGQLIVNVPDADMVIVSTANPDYDWDVADEHERAILHVIAQYVVPAIRR
jgi:CubicO group peptidase (beta-lactamase class C family)